MRVLLVEDDQMMARSIESMLNSQGFNIFTTDLGEEGLDLGKLYEYDAIILDINLPDMSGYDVLKRLRNSKINTPILILSGLAETDDKIRGFGVGADDYLTKPFNKDELISCISAPKLINSDATLNASEFVLEFLKEDVSVIIVVSNRVAIKLFIGWPKDNIRL